MSYRCPACGGRLVECKDCGLVFSPLSAAQKRCKKCGEALKRERNKKYCKRYYKKRKSDLKAARLGVEDANL